MSQDAQIPEPYRHGRSGLLGPIVLITIGVLFLLQLTTPEWGFDRTWPLILIVIGVVKIIERFSPA